MTDTWTLITRQRTSLIEQLADLPAHRWDEPSLCPGWRVRDVVAHTILPEQMTMIGMLVDLAKNGFSVARFVHQDAVKRGSAPVDELVAAYRKGIPVRTTPPTRTAENVLSDLFIHAQDIRRPLGMTWEHDQDLLTLVARTVSTDRALGAPRRTAGLHLVATDVDWSTGSGPQVTGPAEALVLAAAGRTATLKDLSGPGWRPSVPDCRKTRFSALITLQGDCPKVP